MVRGSAPLSGGLENEPELLAYAHLAHHLVKGAGTKGRLYRPLVTLRLRGGERAEVPFLGEIEVVIDVVVEVVEVVRHR